MNNLIINADDLGLSESVNDAIIYCLKNEYIDRATLMVNMPGTQDAINKIISNSLQDKIGLHINLTEGRPLTTKIINTEFCEDGLMTGKIFKTNPMSKVFLSKFISTSHTFDLVYNMLYNLMCYKKYRK